MTYSGRNAPPISNNDTRNNGARRKPRNATLTSGIIGAVATVIGAVVTGVLALWGQNPTPSPAPETGSAAVAQAAGAAPTANPTQPTRPPISTPEPAPGAAGGEATGLLFDGEVTLARLTAVDLDNPNPTVSAGEVGATGNFDLYHDKVDSLRSHDGDVYVYPTGAAMSATKAYEICADYTGPAPSYNAVNPGLGASQGTTFCFVTSDDHLAWANVQGVDTTSHAAVVRVRIWNTLVNL
jgi:hypothetical protein